VLDKHYDPTLGCIDWPAKRLEYGRKVAEASSRADAYRIMNEMLEELEQSHFQVIDLARDDDVELGPAVPALQVRWIEDQLVVVESRTDRVAVGAVVIGIEGEPVQAMIDHVQQRESDASPFAFALARAAMARMSCPRAGMQRKLELIEGSRQTASTVIRVVSCEDPRGELVTLGNLRNVPTRVEHRMIEGTTVGYLAFNIWMLPMVRRVEAAMADLRAKNMTALILDLRGNPGGVGPMSVPVARLLLAEPGSLGKLQFRDFAQEFKVEPSQDPFEGPVVILVDEGTASTSEIFASGMRDLGRVQIVGGRSSAGAALPSVIEQLDEGALLQYVVGDYHSPKGTVVEGKGVVPDVVVSETRADFAAGRDSVLDAAVLHVQAEQG
jgi:carboxyl-terminal processing protease